MANLRISWSGRGHSYTDEDIAAVVDVMRHADPLTQGQYLAAFERDFSAMVDAHPCLGLTNCAHALELAAILSRVGAGDEVIVPAHTYCASAIPFARTGAKLVWADIDPATFLVNTATIERCLSHRTKVIVVVHLYGMIVPEIVEIAALARSRGIVLVEDCAQSLGARHIGRSGGTFGDFGTFSFHAQKNLTTLGEGGMLSIGNPELLSTAKGLRHNGHQPFKDQANYWQPAMTNVVADIPGVWPHNFSMSEAQAALGSSLLKRLDALTAHRRSRAMMLRTALADFEELNLQAIDQPEAHAHHLFVSRYDPPNPRVHRDHLIRILFERFQIKSIVQYYPLYRYDLFRSHGLGEADCPNTDRFFNSMISLPFHAWMSDLDFDYLIESLTIALKMLRQH